MFGLDLGKYRTIVISIGLFLLFDLGVLVLYFAISSEIGNDALKVNLAGRQRMLSRRTAKVALPIEDRVATGAPRRRRGKRTEVRIVDFRQHPLAFIGGGQTLSGAGQPIEL